MTSSLNLSLTDELRSFINSQCGDGTLYATPSEFLRSLLREKKERLEAEALRQGILLGYDDAINNRTIEFRGDLKAMMEEARRRDEHGW